MGDGPGSVERGSGTEVAPDPGGALAAASVDAPSSRSGLRVPVVVLIALGCAVLGLLLGRLGSCARATEEAAPTASVVLRPTPHFAAAVRELAEVATVEQTLGRVIDVSERQQSWGTLGFTVEDKLLFVAHGQVRAGVDLAALRDEDVTVDADRQRVRVVLPPPKILITRLDNQQSYVYARSQDWLAKRAENLESRARQEAEGTLEQAAVEAGILGQARRNARTVVTTLIHQLGYPAVEVVFGDELDGDARERPTGVMAPASPSAPPR